MGRPAVSETKQVGASLLKQALSVSIESSFDGSPVEKPALFTQWPLCGTEEAYWSSRQLSAA